MDIQTKIKNFFNHYQQYTYRKGETLIPADEAPSGIFYLTDGSVKESVISQKGEEFVINIFRPISFFPMSWAMNNTHNSYFFEAMTDVTVRKAPREDVLTFIKQEPDVLYDSLCRVYKGTDGLLLRMTYLMIGTAYPRLITELIIHAKRFGKELKISERDLASQSGLTRETVSREMKKLKEKGLVSLQSNRISITNISLLEEELI